MSSRYRTPKHKNPTRDDRTAIAPYNFVPVPPRVVALPDDDPRNFLLVEQDVYHEDRLNGWIDVTLETKSPIYVRGTLTMEEYLQKEQEESDKNNKTPHLDKLRNKPDFFDTGDPNTPVIPGSSLRGMIRQLVEIIGHGKLSQVSDLPLVFRAIVDEQYRNMMVQDDSQVKDNHFTPKVLGGYMRQEGGQWFIQPAEEHDGVTFARISHKRLENVRRAKQWHDFKATRHVYIETNDYDYKAVRGGFLHMKKALVTEIETAERSGLREAVVLESGPMNKKASEAVIYAPDANKEWLAIGEEMATAYLNQVTVEQEKILGDAEGVLRDHHPVFYLTNNEGQVLFFGHTQMFRIPYDRSPKQMLHPHHSDESRLDFAEAMFGRIKGDNAAMAGRVFFGDAVLTGKEGTAPIWLTENALIPKTLNSPKPTTYQHYLTQDKPDSRRGQELYTYNNSALNTTLRGHKMYWHKGDVQAEQIAERGVDRQKDKIHTQMRPLRSGLTFTCRIRFENLLPEELGLLWWALQPQAQGTYYHKIGMGKPLGLGAVSLTAEVAIIRPSSRYGSFIRKGKLRTGKLKAERGDQEVQQGISRLEQYILNVLRQSDSTFADLPRIKMLLKMMSWEGPSPSKTRYMEIERPNPKARRGKENEYRDRPVLPDPLSIKD